MTFISPIVEGQGEQQCIEKLLFRIASAQGAGHGLRVNAPIRVKSGSFVNDDAYFRRYLSLAAAKARQRAGHVLVLLDSEDDCPATLGPALLGRTRRVIRDVNVVVALAHREYESWFVTAVESLRGHQGLSEDAERPPQPESMRDAKGWLGRLMPHRYDPISHQLPFTLAFDLQAARANPSFDRLCRKLSEIFQPPA